MENKKSILVIGAGAIGGYIGVSLADAGHDVAFVCRPNTARVVREKGLKLTRPESVKTIFPDVFESATEAIASCKYDLIVLSVKRYDTAAAVEPLRPYASKLPPIMNLQNGVGAEEDLCHLLGKVDIIPGTVTTAVGRPAPNEIEVEKFRGVGIAGPHPEAAYWASEFIRIGLGGRLYTDAKSMKWSKLVTNLIANPSSAILDYAPPEIFSNPDLFRLEMLQLREAFAVMRLLGADVMDLPGTPVRLLSFCAQHLPLIIARPLLGKALGKGRGGKMPSFHGDLYGGSGKSEIQYLHGAVVREGSNMGIATPVNALFVTTLMELIEGKRKTAEFRRRPELLLAQID